MFKGFTSKTIKFMLELRLNNQKSWFEKHKTEYKRVLEKPMRELAEEVYNIFSSSHNDLNLRLHISRIYRDARRPSILGPYKDHLWFTIRQQAEEWTDKPVFWFELTPEVLSYGMGYYCAKPLTMSKLRARIDSNPESLQNLNNKLSAQTEFVLEGNEYVRAKCDTNSPLASWYNKKTFSIIHEEEINDAVFSPDLVARIVQGFEFLIPYFNYFVTLDDDPDPALK